MNEGTIKEELKGWIRARAKLAATDALNDDTPILEQGILSSLDVVELVLFIESLRGDEVDIDAIEPEVLTDVDSLYAGFFQQAA